MAGGHNPNDEFRTFPPEGENSSVTSVTSVTRLTSQRLTVGFAIVRRVTRGLVTVTRVTTETRDHGRGVSQIRMPNDELRTFPREGGNSSVTSVTPVTRLTSQ